MTANGSSTELRGASLSRLMTAPSSEALWALRAGLLVEGIAPDHPLLPILGRAHTFVTELESKSTARQYSHFASLLDIGAVGGVVVQNILDGISDGGLLTKLLTGGISESLMILAARQYVNAWEKEMGAVYIHAAWNLYQDLWSLAAAQRPEFDPAERHTLVATLIAPIRDTETPGAARAALIVRLYQVLLLAHLATLRQA